MRYLIVTECTVGQGRMQEFTTEVQKWEQDAMHSEHAPELHAVYLRTEDPSRVLIVTQFPSQEAARGFESHMTEFKNSVLAPASDDSVMNAFDLFYAATPEGAEVVFGEDVGHD